MYNNYYDFKNKSNENVALYIASEEENGYTNPRNNKFTYPLENIIELLDCYYDYKKCETIFYFYNQKLAYKPEYIERNYAKTCKRLVNKFFFVKKMMAKAELPLDVYVSDPTDDIEETAEEIAAFVEEVIDEFKAIDEIADVISDREPEINNLKADKRKVIVF